MRKECQLQICPNCDQQFMQNKHWQIYCKKSCQVGPPNYPKLKLEAESLTKDAAGNIIEVVADFHPSILGDWSPRPTVYGWWRKDRYLYIGCSHAFITRMKSHNIIGRLGVILESDELHLWSSPFTLDEFNGYTLEAVLILLHKPKFNFNQNPYLPKQILELRDPDLITSFKPVNNLDSLMA